MAVNIAGLTSFANASTTFTAPGLGSALSCLYERAAWESQSRAYNSAHAALITKTFTVPRTTTSNIVGGTTDITRLSILCDEHSHVIGQVSYRGRTDTTITTNCLFIQTTTQVRGSYPTPPPCTISPNDCQSLLDAYSRQCTSGTTTADKLCHQPRPTCIASSSSSREEPSACTEPAVFASHARLLYWPVRTVSTFSLFCQRPAQTYPGPRTATGPNTFVTGNVTITSPSVAISLGGLTRYDGCGANLVSTILPIDPRHISSIRGVGTTTTVLPFEYVDLDYNCRSEVVEIPGQPTVAPSARPDCYQAVPGSAYFSGYSYWRTLTDPANQIPPAHATVYPNYIPEITLPPTVTEALRSAFGASVYVNADGVWDRPQAMNSYSNVDPKEPFTLPVVETVGAVQKETSIEGVKTYFTPGAVQKETTVDGVTFPKMPANAVQHETTVAGVTRPDVSSVGAVQKESTIEGVFGTDGGDSNPPVRGTAGLDTVRTNTAVEGVTRPRNSLPAETGKKGASQTLSAGASVPSVSSATPLPQRFNPDDMTHGAVVVTQGQTYTISSNGPTFMLVNSQTTFVVASSLPRPSQTSTTASFQSSSSGTSIHLSDIFMSILISLSILTMIGL